MSSFFVKAEVLPIPLNNKKTDEVAFYNDFFNNVKVWAGEPKTFYPEPIKEILRARNFYRLLKQGYTLAEKYGLGILDAVHIACALSVDANELIAAEKPTKPFYSVTEGKLKIYTVFQTDKP